MNSADINKKCNAFDCAALELLLQPCSDEARVKQLDSLRILACADQATLHTMVSTRAAQNKLQSIAVRLIETYKYAAPDDVFPLAQATHRNLALLQRRGAVFEMAACVGEVKWAAKRLKEFLDIQNEKIQEERGIEDREIEERDSEERGRHVHAKKKEQGELACKYALHPLASGRNLNEVYIVHESEAVFKRQLAKLDSRAFEVSGWLGMPRGVVPSLTKQVTGAINIATVENPHIRPQVTGIVQPQIVRYVKCKIFREDSPLRRAFLSRLDVADTQKKVALQALLGAFDLHDENAFLVPQVNEEFLQCEAMLWEYSKDASTWNSVDTFIEFVQLRLAGEISDATLVRNESNATSQRYFRDDQTLQKACSVYWQFEFFDNEATLGGNNGARAGDPNTIARKYGKITLPSRLFTLGLPLSHDPLQGEVRAWILSLRAQKSFIEKEAAANSYHLLSEETQAQIKRLSTDPYIKRLDLSTELKIAEDLVRCGAISPSKWPTWDVDADKAYAVEWLEFFQAVRCKNPDQKLSSFYSDLVRVLQMKIENPLLLRVDFYRIFFEITQELHVSNKTQPVALDNSWEVHEERVQNVLDTARLWDMKCESAERSRYLQFFEDRLFPKLVPLEAKALIARIDAAILYVEQEKARSTLYGLHAAMHPHFRVCLDLMSKIVFLTNLDDTDILSAFQHLGALQEALVAIGNREALGYLADLNKLQQLFLRVNEVEADEQFIYENWGAEQAFACEHLLRYLHGFARVYLDSINAEWEASIIADISFLRQRRELQITSEEHRKYVEEGIREHFDDIYAGYINSNIEQLKRLFGKERLVSFLKEYLENGDESVERLFEIQDTILLGLHTFKDRTGKECAYSYTNIGEVLDQAIALGLLDNGIDNPLYKEMTASIKELSAFA